jgi:acylphosphatase
MIARRIVVRGRVQGVGFRQATLEAAASCAVAGWVRNRVDGTVEVFAQGEASEVARLVEWCRGGPRAARVSGVDVAEGRVDAGITGFRLLPTA